MGMPAITGTLGSATWKAHMANPLTKFSYTSVHGVRIVASVHFPIRNLIAFANVNTKLQRRKEKRGRE